MNTSIVGKNRTRLYEDPTLSSESGWPCVPPMVMKAADVLPSRLEIGAPGIADLQIGSCDFRVSGDAGEEGALPGSGVAPFL